MTTNSNLEKFGKLKSCCTICKREITYNNLEKHHIACLKTQTPKIKKVRQAWNKGRPAWNRGLTKDTDDRVKRGSEKYSENAKLGLINFNRDKWSDERRNNHSESMRKAALENPNSYSGGYNRGRCKSIEYSGIQFDSSWEVIVAKWLDKNLIKWERNTIPFEYEWHGKRSYYPDFYLPELDKYIEVKGYETERDKAKWSYFKKELIIIKKKEIKLIEDDKLDPENLVGLLGVEPSTFVL